MDETILTTIPPVRAQWALPGTQAVVPIRGEHRTRMLYGTMSRRGGLLIHDPSQCKQEECQTYLHLIRSLWRGGNIVLCLDSASPHTAEASIVLAEDLGLAVRWLPVACPKLNPMDHLWRHITGEGVAHTPHTSLDECVAEVYQYLQDIGPAGWMRKAGLFSEPFWLREYCTLV